MNNLHWTFEIFGVGHTLMSSVDSYDYNMYIFKMLNINMYLLCIQNKGNSEYTIQENFSSLENALYYANITFDHSLIETTN